MNQNYQTPLKKRISTRIYKPLNKPASNLNSGSSDSPAKDDKTLMNLRRSYSPTKIVNKQMPLNLKSQFSLCTSKNVLVFARKQISCNKPSFMRSKQYYRREMREEVFCSNSRVNQPYYRSMVRSNSGKRQVSLPQSQRKRCNSQNFTNPIRINPEPWQMKGEGHELQSLF